MPLLTGYAETLGAHGELFPNTIGMSQPQKSLQRAWLGFLYPVGWADDFQASYQVRDSMKFWFSSSGFRKV